MGGLICLVVGEYREFSGLLKCNKGIFSSLFFVLKFFFKEKEREKKIFV